MIESPELLGCICEVHIVWVHFFWGLKQGQQVFPMENLSPAAAQQCRKRGSRSVSGGYFGNAVHGL